MLHYVRIAVTAFSLTACVLLIALWVRSAYTPDLRYYFSETRHVEVWSYCGRVCFNTGAVKIYLPATDIVGRERISNRRRMVMERELQSAREHRRPPIPETNSFGFKWANWNHFVIPYWLTVLVTATLAVTPWFKGRFSLRTLLIATTLVAIGLGIIAAGRF